MADSPLFQALHMEMTHALCAEREKGLSALEGVGFRVGQGLSERLTKETPSFKGELDVLKFLCKDLWIAVFKKQGTYVLQDNQFLLLSQLSNGKQYLEEAPKFLAFTCGLVKGALSNLGFDSTVTAEVPVMPCSKFQVVIQKS
ncbi:trafficking protein particle complex subunit 6A isoform X2 [Carettochelys insculpta]|uniref:trafficking protein particle complex subunit 6A isoform X2 n=1 Tax=Carettochelys insculpta TaxID=44489 RepID=UPI003EB6CF06